MDIIKIYVDGACSGNPGIAGIGIVFIYKNSIKEHSECLGPGTNNIAELNAVKRALELLKRKDIPIEIYTDSQYVISSLTGNWNLKKNLKLISEIKELLKTFYSVKFIKVEAHSGDKFNERANRLAVLATKSKF